MIAAQQRQVGIIRGHNPAGVAVVQQVALEDASTSSSYSRAAAARGPAAACGPKPGPRRALGTRRAAAAGSPRSRPPLA